MIRMPRLRGVIGVIVPGVAALVICALVFALIVRGSAKRAPDDSKSQVPPRPVAAISLKDLPSRGDVAAKLAVLEFGDFECPKCRAFAQEEFPSLEREFIATGRARFYFRHLLLDDGRTLTRRAALLAACAHKLGNGWSAHDRLFTGPLLSEALIVENTAKMRESGVAVDGCLAETATTDDTRDRQIAAALAIDETPSFVIGYITAETMRVTARLSSGTTLGDIRASLQAAADASR